MGLVLQLRAGLRGNDLPEKGSDIVTKEKTMKAKAIKKTKTVAKDNGIVCGNLNNIQEASRELDHTMKVVWTSVGFWACPKP
jgi:nicotinate-nucleotide pyrophosphorylase